MILRAFGQLCAGDNRRMHMRWEKVETYTHEDLIDEIQGLECGLNHAIELMCRVASGKQTLQAMGEWMSLNYPKYRHLLPKGMQVLPPTRKR